MQQAIPYPPTADLSRRADLVAVLPLYLASLVVTLAAVGAVGVTITATNWLGIWTLLTVVGHGVSLWLRWLRLPSEAVFYPVMLLGSTVAFQQLLVGSPMVGMDAALTTMPPDQATAVIVGALGVVRTFTLVTNGSLLFSPVPAIAMLALAGSSNLNREIPINFGLMLLGSIFLTSYESHLRRTTATDANTTGGAPLKTVSILYHLLAAWLLACVVGGAAILFPLVVHPVLAPLSPFNLPAMARLRAASPFNQFNGNQAPVGQGPIRLSPTPVYRIYSQEGGLYRTGALAHYTGKGWEQQGPNVYENAVDPYLPVGTLQRMVPTESGVMLERTMYEYRFNPYVDLKKDVKRRTVRQRIVTMEFAPQGIPTLGRISTLVYPGSSVKYHVSEVVSGRSHQSTGSQVETEVQVVDYDPRDLQKAPAVDPNTFVEPDTLELPQSTYRVQELARKITAGENNAYDKMQAIIRHIEKTCAYTLLEEPTPAGQDAADFYLFQTKRGACDLAATATAVMARSVGIPARVAIGYVADEPLTEGGEGFLVRQQHAHMWVEAFFPDFGWVPFNPAPTLTDTKDNPFVAAWYRVQSMFTSLTGGGPDAILLGVVLLATLALVGYSGWSMFSAWKTRRRKEQELFNRSPGTAVAMVYQRSLRQLERRGWSRDPALTPAEFLAEMREKWTASPEALAALSRMTEVYTRARYAGDGTAEDLREAQAAAQVLGARAPVLPRAQRPKPQRQAMPKLSVKGVG